MRYVCIHDLDDYIRSILDRGDEVTEEGVRIVGVYPDTPDGKIVCAVEAPSREALLCWLTRVNAHCRGRGMEEVTPPKELTATQGIQIRAWLRTASASGKRS